MLFNIIFIIKPKIPLLNIIFGFVLPIFTLISYNDLPFNPLSSILFIVIGLILSILELIFVHQYLDKSVIMAAMPQKK